MKRILFGIFFFVARLHSAQDSIPPILLNNIKVQFELIEAIDSMYNFNFEVSERQFGWLKQQYPKHPLPYFMLALNEWYKILPNENIEEYDDTFLDYLEQAIEHADDMYDENDKNPEATFFLSASYGFKARLHAERGNYLTASWNSKKALSYLNETKEINTNLDAEFMFGTALYDYYREWIPKHKKMLKPIIALFPKGNMEQGINNLKKVSNEAFYTRTEAMRYLARIYYGYENKPNEAWRYIEYLHKLYPNNPYFSRYYIKIAYKSHRRSESQKVACEILEKVEDKQFGYENESGRIASFILGTYSYQRKDTTKAFFYFDECLRYTELPNAYSTGYTVNGLHKSAKMSVAQSDLRRAYFYYSKIKELSNNKKSASYKEAKKFVRQHRKEFR